ncbi:MAG: PspA-associated protein PspAB [Methermicoccaceae archaeon]
MGLFDALFGRSRPVKPKPDAIYELPSAVVSIEALFDMKPDGRAGLCIKPVPSHYFRELTEDVKGALSSTSDEGMSLQFSKDGLGYQWVVLDGGDVEGMVAAIGYVVESLRDAGYGDRLLCALFSFQNEKRAYLVYGYKRGAFYPFVPEGSHARDNQLELKMATLLKGELTLEEDESRWYPIWDAPL